MIGEIASKSYALAYKLNIVNVMRKIRPEPLWFSVNIIDRFDADSAFEEVCYDKIRCSFDGERWSLIYFGLDIGQYSKTEIVAKLCQLIECAVEHVLYEIDEYCINIKLEHVRNGNTSLLCLCSSYNSDDFRPLVDEAITNYIECEPILTLFSYINTHVHTYYKCMITDYLTLIIFFNKSQNEIQMFKVDEFDNIWRLITNIDEMKKQFVDLESEFELYIDNKRCDYEASFEECLGQLGSQKFKYVENIKKDEIQECCEMTVSLLAKLEGLQINEEFQEQIKTQLKFMYTHLD